MEPVSFIYPALTGKSFTTSATWEKLIVLAVVKRHICLSKFIKFYILHVCFIIQKVKFYLINLLTCGAVALSFTLGKHEFKLFLDESGV